MKIWRLVDLSYPVNYTFLIYNPHFVESQNVRRTKVFLEVMKCQC